MNKKLNDYKDRAKLLRKAISTVLNVECSQSQAYEIMAKEENYPNWDSLSGVIKNNQLDNLKKPLLTIKEQMVQLFILHEGLNNGCPLKSMVNILKEQKNPILKNGWSNLKFEDDKNYSHIFEQTHFFNEEVLTLLTMGAHVGYLPGAVKSALEFLKLDIHS